MLESRWSLRTLAVFLAVLVATPAVRSADKEKKTGGTVSGVIVNGRGSQKFDDKTIKVLVDGQDEATDFTLPATASPQLVKVWKKTFLACRVRLTYKLNGDVREITALGKPPSRARGTITGTVVHNYDFWVIVKPKKGSPDGFMFSFPPKQAIKDTMKSLSKGDRVSIQYYTDFERHRIVAMEKLGSAKKPPKR